ncbi:MAG: asparagine synthase (glutamine-hydrolyzing) [Lachnospiraceae bacterium]|nr:asparagine synthase (glutamine-hydrolyzing) [Lachnospiraceae bacterium]
MCSIAGMITLDGSPNKKIRKALSVMNEIQAHRGPDGEGIWVHVQEQVGFAHRRLSIIDLESGKQPMKDHNGNYVCFNGEIFNYLELREELGGKYETSSDTEVILKAYEKWGRDCLFHFNGMFAFALWDEKRQELFCARDRFGIKPFYYMIADQTFYFASEIKALLPFMKEIRTDMDGLKDYLTFQFCLAGKTLFSGVRELMPAHYISVLDGHVKLKRYWQIYYNLDWDHTEKYFMEHLEELVQDSIRYRVRSDVPIGGYVSGGLDSSIVSALASDLIGGQEFAGFTGKFSISRQYDESSYAQALADEHHFPLYQIDITSKDFEDNIRNVIYYLDEPVAGPGSFCQYMVSMLAAKYRKVVLGGQGGDEIFGGYTRYLVAYFEQCIKGAIDGTMNSGNYIVTYESIIPNLVSLRNYKPMLAEFWKDGLFEDLDRRYYRLINRAPQIAECIRPELLDDYDPYETFHGVFSAGNVEMGSYFDRMTHFDFKTLLPALLHVEDRMSMAHGLESRVPLLDYRLIEFVATIPSNFKLKNGDMKYIFKETMKGYLPECIQNRKDKMGFPLPLNSWLKNELKDFIGDIFSSAKAQQREFIDNRNVFEKIQAESQFGRNAWGLLSLELWQREFHDKALYYRQLLEK